MMKLDHALHILKVRRAICILCMICISVAGYWYVGLVDKWMSVDHPQVSGFFVGMTILTLAVFWLTYFYWLCRLCYGIWWLSGVKRRTSGGLHLFCPVTFRVKFKNGAYDFL
jgi:hypothetical protein